MSCLLVVATLAGLGVGLCGGIVFVCIVLWNERREPLEPLTQADIDKLADGFAQFLGVAVAIVGLCECWALSALGYDQALPLACAFVCVGMAYYIWMIDGSEEWR